MINNNVLAALTERNGGGRNSTIALGIMSTKMEGKSVHLTALRVTQRKRHAPRLR